MEPIGLGSLLRTRMSALRFGGVPKYAHFSTFVNVLLAILYKCRYSPSRNRRFMPRAKVELTAAEWAIIKAVWEKEPCTAPEVRQHLQRRTAWTYSTVRTLMDRMVVKGLLNADKSQHPTIYSSAVTQAQAQRGELRYALQHAFNGALTPMVQCLLDTGNLSEAELAEIEALIKARRKGARNG